MSAEIHLPHSRYELTAARRAELIDALMARPHGPAPEGLSIRFVEGDDPVADLGREVEQIVFDGAFGRIVPHSPEMMAHEYGPYEEQSRFFLVCDHEAARVVGVLRVIAGLPNKTITDLEAQRLVSRGHIQAVHTLDGTRLWDIGTVAILSEHRVREDFRVSKSLYHALYITSLALGVTDWVSVIDEELLVFLHRLGIPFERLAGLEGFEYLGSSASPCYLRVSKIRASMSMAAASGAPVVRRMVRHILDGHTNLPRLPTGSAIGGAAPVPESSHNSGNQSVVLPTTE